MSEETNEKTPKKTQTKVVESKDGSVRITRPKGTKRRGVTILLDSDDVLKEQMGGFANFLREYAVVGLAIGFVVGQQANAVAKQFVDSFVNPWVQMFFGKSLMAQVAVIHHGSDPIGVPWGKFVYVLMEFLFVVLSIYVTVKLFRLDKLKKKD